MPPLINEKEFEMIKASNELLGAISRIKPKKIGKDKKGNEILKGSIQQLEELTGVKSDILDVLFNDGLPGQNNMYGKNILTKIGGQLGVTNCYVED